MRKQVSAEEIERFLGTVDGVASARLLTSASGGIDQIYVTASELTERRAARRAIVAALMTTYGIPIEPWRVQVAHLRRVPLADARALEVVRVEETLTAAETEVRVQVRWARAGEPRTATGRAAAPSGAGPRLRALAEATIDAVRAVLEPASRRIAVHQVSVATSMDRPLVLVALAAGPPSDQGMFVGAAFQREGPLDAAVAATLDAVLKWFLHAAADEGGEGGAGDRRARLEAMRHFARSDGGGLSGQPAPSAAAPDAAPDPAAPDLAAPSPRPSPDVLEDLGEIRPEQKGGAVMATHHEGARVGMASLRPARQAVEEEFYQPLIEARTPVHIRCRDGYEIAHAIVRDLGTYTILVEAGGATELVYKHAIISIRPRT